jgi:hypothetical protein
MRFTLCAKEAGPSLEIELKALMLARQGGDAAAYRRLLDLLRGRLRTYYSSKLIGFARNAGPPKRQI